MEIRMNRRKATNAKLVPLATQEIAQVSGGVLEQEGIRPRKFGDIDYAVYVDGVYMGTTYAGPGATITGNRTDPLIHV